MANTITHGSTDVINSSAKVTDAALPDSGVSAGTKTATNPTSVDYFNCWQGNATSRPKTDQMNQVILYFQQLGYTIERLKNTSTGKTLKWVISY